MLILDQVKEFFASLLAVRSASGYVLSNSFCDPSRCVSDQENSNLMVLLSVEEIEASIDSGNMKSASVPNGFSIPFFKKFWSILCGIVNIYDICMVI